MNASGGILDGVRKQTQSVIQAVRGRIGNLQDLRAGDDMFGAGLVEIDSGRRGRNIHRFESLAHGVKDQRHFVEPFSYMDRAIFELKIAFPFYREPTISWNMGFEPESAGRIRNSLQGCTGGPKRDAGRGHRSVVRVRYAPR